MKYHELMQDQIDELNQIIEEKIEANDCPHTTDADIRYFETDEYLKEGKFVE